MPRMPEVLKFLIERGIERRQISPYAYIYHDFDGRKEHELIAAIEKRFPFIEARPCIQEGKRTIEMEVKNEEDFQKVGVVSRYLSRLKTHDREHGKVRFFPKGMEGKVSFRA